MLIEKHVKGIDFKRAITFVIERDIQLLIRLHDMPHLRTASQHRAEYTRSSSVV